MKVLPGAGSSTVGSALSLVSDVDGYYAVLTLGGVDCWGYGPDGELGNGTFYTTGTPGQLGLGGGSATPVQVKGVGGSGTLSGVASLASDEFGYCAVLTSGEVDCWGAGNFGQLGNGTLYTSGNGGDATPVQVVNITGSGPLSGVASLASDGDSEFCALLTSGGVDCWGYNAQGELGNGTFAQTAPYGRATPVQVKGISGSGPLSGVASLGASAQGNFCALTAWGGVDCWGDGANGGLGNGTFTLINDTPVQVVSITGSGPLSGVASLESGAYNYCARLTSGGVDCLGALATMATSVTGRLRHWQ